MSSTLVLRTALDVRGYRNVDKSPVSPNSIRLSEYRNGLIAFSNFVQLNEFDAIMLVDNTLPDKSIQTEELLNELPSRTQLVLTNTNRYGKYNKGAGDIETYRYLYKQNLIKSDFIVHFEPRLILTDPFLFEDFFRNPRTILALSPDGLGVQTGYMFLDSTYFGDFCSLRRLLTLTTFNQSIENHMFRYARNRNVELLSSISCTFRIDPLTRMKIPY